MYTYYYKNKCVVTSVTKKDQKITKARAKIQLIKHIIQNKKIKNTFLLPVHCNISGFYWTA